MNPDTHELLSRSRQLEQELERVRRELENRRDVRWLERSFDALWCSAGQTRFAVALEHVQEVLPNAALTAQAEAAEWLCGSLNLAGALVPIVDVARRLGAEPTPSRLEGALIICSVEGRLVGLMASSVPEVCHVQPGEVLRVPGELDDVSYVLAVIRREGQSAPLLGTLALALRCGLLQPEAPV